MSHLTIKKVNKEIVNYGYELVKGKGYFYFFPLKNNPEFYDSLVLIPRLNDFTLFQWEQELKYKIKLEGLKDRINLNT
jgi:hypothetical protein|tara:strand:+ start:5016 stop:5249 length:234 start_codon:yes stop_codon:yes gene_type:complete